MGLKQTSAVYGLVKDYDHVEDAHFRREITNYRHMTTQDVSHSEKTHTGNYPTTVQRDYFTEDGFLIKRVKFNTNWDGGFPKTISKEYGPGNFDWSEKTINRTPFF